MAEERTLGLARALERSEEGLSKEELQLRMGEARDSISQTVTEIKDTVTHQYETVKDALDWREHFKKRPVAWSLGAAGVGFFVGYGIAAAIKDEGPAEERYVPSAPHAYAAQPILGEALADAPVSTREKTNGQDGPGLLERFKETRAFDRLEREVGSIGERVVDEISKTAQVVILPALFRKIKELIGADLSSESQSKPAAASMRPESRTYEPTLERNPS